MCSLDRIYAMLDLERNNQADCSGIPLTSLMARLHEADLTSRPHKIARFCARLFLAAVAAWALRTARSGRECRNHSLTI